MSNNEFDPNKYSYLETRPNNLKILIVIILCSGLFGVYSYFSDKSKVIKLNEPPLDPFWSFVVSNEQVEVYTDLVNVNMENQDSDKVDYWEKIVMLNGFEVSDDINDQILLDFDKPLETIISHFLVNCSNSTYQRLNTIYTQVDGKTRFMNTYDDPLPAVAINDDMLNYYSSQYACQIKDMDIAQRLATVE
ncbi:MULTISPECIES: hypothetical protein [Psychrobacter]|uniref:hypothetical protein n=1 Tax=Psychrobacter TaxID=497 RepID=UPI001917F37A|nr:MULTISPECIES: hypothetical protein [Psychrobacter]